MEMHDWFDSADTVGRDDIYLEIPFSVPINPIDSRVGNTFVQSRRSRIVLTSTFLVDDISEIGGEFSKEVNDRALGNININVARKKIVGKEYKECCRPGYDSVRLI